MLSPGRSAPYRSGEGLPTTNQIVLFFRSTAGFIHTPPPSVWKNDESFANCAFSAAMSRCMSRPVASLTAQTPSWPFSGIVLNVHSSLPSLASNALTKPRMPYSPPLVPIRILPLTATGAIVSESVSYTHLRAHETPEHLVCRLLLEK